MDKIKIAICDDEPNIRSYLASLIRKLDRASEITEYASAESFLSDRAGCDLLFLDIELDDSAASNLSPASPMDGMALARQLRHMEMNRQPLIIFVTGHEQYVYEAFDVEAFQYLVKPIQENRFREVFRRAADRIASEAQRRQKKLMIQYAGTSKVIPLDNIYYMESQGHKILLHLTDGTLEYYGRLGALEQELQGQFSRIHKGYLVNLAYVEEYTRSEVTLTNGDKLLLSKYKYNDFVKAYLRYMQ